MLRVNKTSSNRFLSYVIPSGMIAFEYRNSCVCEDFLATGQSSVSSGSQCFHFHFTWLDPHRRQPLHVIFKHSGDILTSGHASGNKDSVYMSFQYYGALSYILGDLVYHTVENESGISVVFLCNPPFDFLDVVSTKLIDKASFSG